MVDLNEVMFPFDKDKRNCKSNIMIIEALKKLSEEVNDLKTKLNNLTNILTPQQIEALNSTITLDKVNKYDNYNEFKIMVVRGEWHSVISRDREDFDTDVESNPDKVHRYFFPDNEEEYQKMKYAVTNCLPFIMREGTISNYRGTIIQNQEGYGYQINVYSNYYNITTYETGYGNNDYNSAYIYFEDEKEFQMKGDTK